MHKIVPYTESKKIPLQEENFKSIRENNLTFFLSSENKIKQEIQFLPG